MNTEAIPQDRILPLGSNRIIRLTIGKAPVDFTFLQISDKTWRKFLEQVVTRVEQQGEERVRQIDEESALVWLFGETCAGVSGYKGSEGVDAKLLLKRVPINHRIAAASVLRMVEVKTDFEQPLSDLTEIRLEAPWSLGADGQMEMYTGLVHRFTQPTIEQYRRFRLGVSRVAVSGDASNGVTVYPSRLAVALGLYDELIAEVEGYSVNGVLLADKKAIAASMDGIHKSRAVLELFERSDEEIFVGNAPAPLAATEAADAAAE